MSLGGLSLPALLASRAAADQSSAGDRKAVILVWLQGGASHLETYDPKPLSGSAYRGPYDPIATDIPGMEICELLPHHARVAGKFSLLRSMVHTGFAISRAPSNCSRDTRSEFSSKNPITPTCFPSRTG